jgi:hypothetical protein
MTCFQIQNAATTNRTAEIMKSEVRARITGFPCVREGGVAGSGERRPHVVKF